MQNKLLPCTFCGGEAKIHNVEPHTHILAKFMPDCKGESFIECTECTCAMSGDTEEEVVNAWNTRKPMERIVEQLEELEDKDTREVYLKKHIVLDEAIEIVRKGGVEDAE